MFKICNYVGPKKVLEKGIKQEIMGLEPTRLSNGLDMERDVGIKALNLGDLCNTLTQGRKSARSQTEEGSSAQGKLFSRSWQRHKKTHRNT